MALQSDAAVLSGAAPARILSSHLSPDSHLIRNTWRKYSEFASNALHSAAVFSWKAWVLLFQTHLLTQLFKAKCFVCYVQLKSGLPKVAGQTTVGTDLQLSVNQPPTQLSSSSSLCTVCFEIALIEVCFLINLVIFELFVSRNVRFFRLNKLCNVFITWRWDLEYLFITNVLLSASFVPAFLLWSHSLLLPSTVH